jgi:hypothetical protein
MIQCIQRANWVCQRMKDYVFGIERRFLAVLQKGTQEYPAEVYYRIVG